MRYAIMLLAACFGPPLVLWGVMLLEEAPAATPPKMVTSKQIVQFSRHKTGFPAIAVNINHIVTIEPENDGTCVVKTVLGEKIHVDYSYGRLIHFLEKHYGM